MEKKITELALTLGSWGNAPLTPQEQRKTAEQLSRWAARTRIPLRIESYMDAENDRTVLERLLGLNQEGAPVVPVVRLEPRSDRWAVLRDLGVREAVFDVPVGQAIASTRFTPHGVERSPGFAAEGARDAVLAGVLPEVALVDICRARPEDVRRIVLAVMEEMRPRGIFPRWRLVDETGVGNPLPGKRIPESLAAWIRWMEKELSITPENITVQASDLRGLALANTLAGVEAGAGAATALFGLGLRAGWTATEAVLFHRHGENVKLKGLLSLRGTLHADTRRDRNRPISGQGAWQVLGGTTPEDSSGRVDPQLACDPAKITGIQPEPVLTALSGHAGLLHLMHNNYPDHHFESDGSESLSISESFEAQFKAGRHQPVCWNELAPAVNDSGLLDSESEAAEGDSESFAESE